jgi:hypothetical protein
MAIATRLTTAVTVLYLSNEEAQVLCDIASRVGGCPDTSRRRLTDNVADALYGVGFRFTDSTDLADGLSRLYFEDRT